MAAILGILQNSPEIHEHFFILFRDSKPHLFVIHQDNGFYFKIYIYLTV